MKDRMLIYKLTNTLDGYLPDLSYTTEKSKAEIVIVGGKKIVLSDFPKLRGIFKTGVGVDNLPFVESAERGIQIGLPSSLTNQVVYEETASFTCQMILSGLYMNVGDWRTWYKHDRGQLLNKKLLVLGLGNIGGRVMHKMKVFMQVDGFDITQNSIDVLEGKMRDADCITLHIPLNSHTKNFLCRERLSWLPNDALVVNTARGGVIEEEAIYDELNSGRLKAAFDVFWDEPYLGRLNSVPEDRFIRTPHIASTCKEFIRGTANDFLNFMSEFS